MPRNPFPPRTQLATCTLALGSALLVAGCLDADPRPPPASVLVSAAADDAILSGVETSDGWSVTFDRFLISLGRASVEDDLAERACNLSYSDPAYLRVLDARADARQKLGLLFALGRCSVDLELASPWEDSVLGEGVTAADREFMRTPGSDAYVTDGGTSIHAVGRAENGGRVKTFAWTFRRRVDYTNCSFGIGGELVQGIDLEENEEASLDFPVRGAVLFWDRVDEPMALRFDAFALADDVHGDGDGAITLAELGAMPLAEIATVERYAYASSAGFETLADHLYRSLFPLVVEAHPKETEVFPNDRVPH